MKITLISPLPEIISFGLRSIAAYAETQGIDTQLIFLPDQEFERKGAEGEQYHYNDSIIAQVVETCKDSDLIGITLFSNNLTNAIDLTKKLKQQVNTPIMWGGKHPSAMPEMCLKHVDIVAIGESEIPIVKLCRKISEGENYYSTEGFWFKQDEKVFRNNPGALVKDLDSIPIKVNDGENHYIWDIKVNKLLKSSDTVFAKFSDDNPFTAGKAYNIMTSRGCPFSCSYCYTYKNLYKGQKYVRRRSVRHAIDELKEAKNRIPALNLISINDDEFMSSSYDYLKEFCHHYKKEINLPFHCLFHPQTVTAEKLELLVDAGLSVVQMGIQTGSSKTLSLYRRSVTNERTFESVKLINKYKDSLLPSYDFILDNPFESNKELIETIRFIATFPNPFTLTVFSLVFFPGTELFNKAVAEGIIDPNDESSYLKKYQHLQYRYLNIIVLLLKAKVPQKLIYCLTSKPMVFLFERKSLTFLYSSFFFVFRKFKTLVGLRAITGGFSVKKRTEKIAQSSD